MKLVHKLEKIVKLVDEIPQNVHQQHAFLIDLEQQVGHKCDIAPGVLVKLGYKMEMSMENMVEMSMENMVVELVMLAHKLVSLENYLAKLDHKLVMLGYKLEKIIQEDPQNVHQEHVTLIHLEHIIHHKDRRQRPCHLQ